MFGLFKRRPTPPSRIPEQPKSESDWATGDTAECLCLDGPWKEHPSGETRPGPRRGQIVRVTDVVVAHGYLWLGLAGYDGGFSAGYFRKLRPCAAEFREQLKQRRPTPARKPELV